MQSATDKSVRYDRQLRLWGSEGQQRLENSSILLLNANATGAEALKNLVLPGIGSFTIVDGGLVEMSDIGSNFFVVAEAVGQSRAKVVTDYLLELNELVRGEYFHQDVTEFCREKGPEFFKRFDVVITTTLAFQNELAEILFNIDVPLLIARSHGFIGYLRLVVPEHRIEETKPDSSFDDLRLSRPFEELERLAKSFDIDDQNLSKHLHKHIPYVVLLLNLLEIWKTQHNGKIPTTRQEKDEFKALIRSKAWSSEEDNFQEATDFAYYVWSPYTIPSDIKTLFADEKCLNLTPQSPPFWIIVNALKTFVEKHGVLPLNGAIPDMTADTETFIRLQRIYQEKAIRDAELVTDEVRKTLNRFYGSESHILISDEFIKKFCKNSNFLNVIRYRSLQQSRTNPVPLEPEEDALFYVALCGVEEFYFQEKRLPGQLADELFSFEKDVPKLQQLVNQISQNLISPEYTFPENVVHELCRYGSAELHNIASIIGGIASQEIIKIITKQYTPLDNTFIFNGIKGRGVTLCA